MISGSVLTPAFGQNGEFVRCAGRVPAVSWSRASDNFPRSVHPQSQEIEFCMLPRRLPARSPSCFLAAVGGAGGCVKFLGERNRFFWFCYFTFGSIFSCMTVMTARIASR